MTFKTPNNPSRISRRQTLLGLASLAGLSWLPGQALAQSFPNKPITIVVPFPAGGTTDILARIVGQFMSTEFNQSVVIDNRAGAGGNVGTQMVARAPADGYTLLMGTVGTHAINAALYERLPFDHIRDFVPLSRSAMVPNILVAHPSQPFNTVAELVAYARANPGKIRFASSGNGTSIHLSGELFKIKAQVDMLHVPYRGSAPAIAGLLGGETDIMFDNMPSAIQHVRSGGLKALAVTTAQRSPEMPNLPTIAEAGVPGYDATSWFGLFAPAGTPDAIVRRLNATIVKALNDNEVRQRIVELGAAPHPETPESFASFIQQETAKWADVMRASGARID